MSGWQKCQLTIEVNNHLGYLYSKFCEDWDPCRMDVKENSITKHELLNIFMIDNVLDIQFSIKLRLFLQEIPFDINKPIINDVDNLPLSNVYHTNQNLILKSYYNNTEDVNEWLWEHYSYCFWRLAPKSLEAFLGSPIPRLITILERTIRSFDQIDGIKTSNLKKGTWVIQRMAQNQQADIHNDMNGTRRLSFIYYLTPDQWDENDGGGLCMLNVKGKKFERINPTFNRLVIWKVNEQLCGLHHVETVKASNDKPRIALVGFFNE